MVRKVLKCLFFGELKKERMNVNQNNDNCIIEGYDIRNGLLGIKRDRFLLLIGHMSFESTDGKTRNV
jgi:hypothetical protein